MNMALINQWLGQLADFHFIRPWWLLAALSAIWLWWGVKKATSREVLDDLVDAHLQAAVVDFTDTNANGDKQMPNRKQPFRWLPGLLALLFAIALAGPTWERLPQPLYQLQQGRVVVLSLSKTMDRQDMQPSRLHRARFKVEDLLASQPGILTGLVAFAGEAFVVAPLSDDQDTIVNLLHSLDSDTLPVSGKRAERGLNKALGLLEYVAIDVGELLLVTDQASPLALQKAAELAQKGLRVSVLEVAPPNDKRQTALLQDIARAGKGVYSRLSADESDLQRLNAPMQAWASRSRSEKNQSQRSADQWRDMGPWLLLPILLLSSLMFRRAWLINVALMVGVLSLSMPQQAQALDWPTNWSTDWPASWPGDWQGAWTDLWQNQSQQQWQAAEAYRKKNLAAAYNGFADDDSAIGKYNQGNVQAQSGELEAAIAKYDEALELDPDFEDAKFNRQLVQAALEKQQQEQQESEKGEGEDGEGEQGEDGEQADEPSEPGENGDELDQNVKTEVNSQDGEAGEEGQAKEGEGLELGLMDEDEQALQLNLRRIPDNPGALLKRKFQYQYENRP